MINGGMFLREDWKDGEKKSMRVGYGEAVVELMKTNSRIVVLEADLGKSMEIDVIKSAFPERVMELGIAEQGLASVAAGMALEGMIPLANSFAVFNPGRNWEQIRVSVCMNQANVKLIGGHAGFGNGRDGANQQAFEDIALARVLPGMMVVAPMDAEQIKSVLKAVVDYEGPVYLRMTMARRPVITSNLSPFELGRAQVVREGNGVSVLACGQMVHEALVAAESLVGKIDLEVINVHTIKPIDRKTIVESAKKTGRVVVAEEHSVVGGLGAAVVEVLVQECPVPVQFVGMEDSFGESGDPDELMKNYMLSADGIVKAVEKVLR